MLSTSCSPQITASFSWFPFCLKSLLMSGSARVSFGTVSVPHTGSRLPDLSHVGCGTPLPQHKHNEVYKLLRQELLFQTHLFIGKQLGCMYRSFNKQDIPSQICDHLARTRVPPKEECEFSRSHGLSSATVAEKMWLGSTPWHLLVQGQQLVPFLNLCSVWINFRMGNH